MTRAGPGTPPTGSALMSSARPNTGAPAPISGRVPHLRVRATFRNDRAKGYQDNAFPLLPCQPAPAQRFEDWRQARPGVGVRRHFDGFCLRRIGMNDPREGAQADP